VGFPSLLDADTTVYARQDKAFTVSTDEASVFFGHTQFGSHGYPARDLDVPLSQFRVFMNHFFG